MTQRERIDVHQHLLPPDYRTWLARYGIESAGGRKLPDWSVEQALEFMGSYGIRTAIGSVSAPGVHLGSDADARVMARRVNEFSAQLVKDHPDRFGFFATLTLPDVDGAIEAAGHALDDLHADGVFLLANHNGIYLGDPRFDPLMAELDSRRAVIFVHPAELPGGTAEGIPPFAVDFLLDTTRAAYNLVAHNVPRRYPNLRFILAHGGGFVPYASHRMALAMLARQNRVPSEALEDLRGFYYDTALSSSPAALPSLLAFAGPGHILYGSDWPFAPPTVVDYFNTLLDSDEALDVQTRRTIDQGNARALFR
jgi:predicted TIM-barrel fold metal-dependent hydrolase